MTSSAQLDGFKFPRIEFCLADGRMEVSASAPGVSVSDRAEPSTAHSPPQISSGDVGSLIRLAAEAARRVETELPGHLARRDRASRRWARASRFPLAPFLSWRLAALRSAAAIAEAELQSAASQRNACRITVRFAFGKRVTRAYLAVVAAFDELSRTGTAWEVGSLPATPPSHPLAGPQIQRDAVQFAPTFQAFMDAGWPGLSVRKLNGSVVELYPGFVMLRSGDDPTLVSVLETKLEYSERAVAEAISPAADATIQHLAWERANKDGSPDQRYVNNRSVPFVRYGLIIVRGPGFSPRSYLISNLKSAQGFATAFADYQRVLTEEAQAPRDVADRRTSIAELVSLRADNRPVVTVPPPPQTGRAHEYTAAAAVAAVCAWAVLSNPSLGGQATAWASRQLPDRAASPTSEAPPALAVQSIAPAQHSASPEPTHPTILGQPELPSPVLEGSPLPTAEASVSVTSPATRNIPPAREQIVTKSGANIRSAPNGEAEVLRTTSSGTRLNVFGRSAGWVRVGGTEAWGWIHSSLLDTAR
ncbi:SH3 domain-containing protein [Muricoccus nepalensis]